MKEFPIVLVSLLFAAALVCGCAQLDLVLGTGEQMACGGTAAKVANIDPDHCYQDAAIRKGDTELCKKIERAPPRTKCIMLIAEKNGDKSVCGQMEDYPGPGEYSRLECLQRVAVKTNDPTVCDLMGTASVSYMFTGEVSKQSCCKAVSSGCSSSVEQMYNKNKENFVFCQDLAYAQIYGKPSDSTTGSQKSDVGTRLTNTNEYYVVAQGRVEKGGVPQVTLKDGDILVLGFDETPDPKNAPHYVVAQGGKVGQILSWKNPNTNQQQGFYDTEDLGWYFSTRTVTNPFTKASSTSPQVYQNYIVYRKK